MRAVREKDYLELMRDLVALRRRRSVTTDPAVRDRLDRVIEEYDGEVRSATGTVIRGSVAAVESSTRGALRKEGWRTGTPVAGAVSTGALG
ncbi:hypothetical protein NDR87_27450 [Nocardia sp. CDC159]|uniref:Uncharacterized protein n=1 Tax=Nocardia pulmonis TaxID=2951408 RepID=A0A9X2EBC0_9NOCA|nr:MULTISPECIES: hypothetical protein [Nocardia]MCM6777229.1 hypothetical protein [Nocardia pulmonis]MCM6790114.1 hypothetical protein [Nocardia sp. CDC159]